MSEIIIALDNIRSTHNVGSILRTCDGFGITKVIALGYTPYPKLKNDMRLPHVSKRATEQIAKTALGAEKNVTVEHYDDYSKLKENYGDFETWSVEQSDSSIALTSAPKLPNKLILMLGNEVDGVNQAILDESRVILEIPMKGQKESLNVSVTAALAIYELTRNL